MSSGNSGRPAGQTHRDHTLECVDILAGGGRDRDHLGSRPIFRPRLDHRKQLGLGDAVDLVERDDDRMCLAGVRERGGIGLVEAIRGAAVIVRRIDDHEHEVGVASGRDRCVTHVPAQRPAPVLYSRRVDVRVLRACRGLPGQLDRVDAEDPVAGRLRLGRHCDQMTAEHAIEQRRLADIRQADNGAKACPNFVHARACSTKPPKTRVIP